MTNLRVPLQRSDSDDRAQWQYPCDTKRLTSISARDSSHKYTSQGVKLLSSATTEKAAERGISRTFGSGNEPSTELKLGVAAQPARGRRAWAIPAAGSSERSAQREPQEGRRPSLPGVGPGTTCKKAPRGQRQALKRRFRAVSHRRDTSRAQSCRPAQRPGRRPGRRRLDSEASRRARGRRRRAGDGGAGEQRQWRRR